MKYMKMITTESERCVVDGSAGEDEAECPENG